MFLISEDIVHNLVMERSVREICLTREHWMGNTGRSRVPQSRLATVTISDPSTASLFLISSGFMRTSGLKKQVRPALVGRTENGKQLIGHSYTDTVIQSSPVSPTLAQFPCRRHRHGGGTFSKWKVRNSHFWVALPSCGEWR